MASKWSTELWFLDEKKHKRVSEGNVKKDQTERSNSWNKNEDFIAKAQRFYKLQTLTSTSGERKGNMREKRERNFMENREALRELWRYCHTGSDQSFCEIFLRDSLNIAFEIWMQFANFPLLHSGKIWDSPKMENYANLSSSITFAMRRWTWLENNDDYKKEMLR